MLKQHELGEVFMRIRDWINRNMGLGLLISLLLCAAGAALGAILMDRELLAVESAGKWMAFMWLSASFAGCKVALQNVQQNRLPHAAEQAVLLYSIVWAAHWPSVRCRIFNQTDGI